MATREALKELWSSTWLDPIKNSVVYTSLVVGFVAIASFWISGYRDDATVVAYSAVGPSVFSILFSGGEFLRGNDNKSRTSLSFTIECFLVLVGGPFVSAGAYSVRHSRGRTYLSHFVTFLNREIWGIVVTAIFLSILTVFLMSIWKVYVSIVAIIRIANPPPERPYEPPRVEQIFVGNSSGTATNALAFVEIPPDRAFPIGSDPSPITAQSVPADEETGGATCVSEPGSGSSAVLAVSMGNIVVMGQPVAGNDSPSSSIGSSSPLAEEE